MAPWAPLLLLVWLVGAAAAPLTPARACDSGSDDPVKSRAKGR